MTVFQSWKKRAVSQTYEEVRKRARKRRPSNCQLFHVSPIRLIEPLHFLPRVQSTCDNGATELSPAAVSVNLPSKLPRTSVNVFSRVPRIHETVPTSMSHRVTNYWRVVPLSVVRNSAWAYAHFRNGLFLL